MVLVKLNASSYLRKAKKLKKRKDAGADFVGSEELVAKIRVAWSDFDVAVATPDMMAKLVV